MATMADVAQRAGVSLSTVSYALSGTRPVTDRTRARIDAAMKELGYQPNAMARGLASKRSHVLALIYPATERGLGGTVAEFVASAARTAREHGYHLVLWPFDHTQGTEICDLARQGMADGVLLMEVALEDARIDALAAANIPYTMIGRTRDTTGRSSVDIDFESTTDDAVAYLVNLGHRHIAFINHSRSSFDVGYAPTFRAQWGYEAAMRSRGLEPISVHCDESPEAGRSVVGQLLTDHPALTALVVMNEIATFGVMAELQQRGIGVPQRMSVLSIVTSPGVGRMSNPVLTTMHTPGGTLGRLGVEKLLSQLGAAAGSPNVLIGCTLEPGQSVARAFDGALPESALDPAHTTH